tara:strand:+ start:38610 stop:39308 length:699 start_codon:yes stop_codon:yes gene_type:complete
MWRLLYDSLEGFKVIDTQDFTQENRNFLIEKYGDINQGFNEMLINLFALQKVDDENPIHIIFIIIIEDKLAGILYGDHVLKLKMKPFYTELIQKTFTIKSNKELCFSIVEKVITRIIKQKNSFISPKEFDILKSFTSTKSDMQYMENTYCIDSSEFTNLKLHHLCTSRQFKIVKNEYSKKWNTTVLMKDFKIAKLYYKKHLLIGFTLYRKVDGEQFFYSGQFQEVLEGLIMK